MVGSGVGSCLVVAELEAKLGLMEAELITVHDENQVLAQSVLIRASPLAQRHVVEVGTMQRGQELEGAPLEAAREAHHGAVCRADVEEVLACPDPSVELDEGPVEEVKGGEGCVERDIHLNDLGVAQVRVDGMVRRVLVAHGPVGAGARRAGVAADGGDVTVRAPQDCALEVLDEVVLPTPKATTAKVNWHSRGSKITDQPVQPNQLDGDTSAHRPGPGMRHGRA
mmetsp:Transcript_39283/g.101875  ORF Transcript_39283/g.101875 Transcript_39283/m.101875 type:complete len:225 (-) Transcript_39283:42-716(-)